MNTLIEAWDYLLAHPYFNVEIPRFKGSPLSVLQEGLEVHVDVVNPKTGKTSKDAKKNTKTVVGLEVCVAVEDKSNPRGFYLAHDMSLDIWADTFEDAIIMLAHRVREKPLLDRLK